MYTDARFKASPKPPAAWRELRTNSDFEGLRTTVAWNSRSLTNHARGLHTRLFAQSSCTRQLYTWQRLAQCTCRTTKYGRVACIPEDAAEEEAAAANAPSAAAEAAAAALYALLTAAAVADADDCKSCLRMLPCWTASSAVTQPSVYFRASVPLCTNQLLPSKCVGTEVLTVLQIPGIDLDKRKQDDKDACCSSGLHRRYLRNRL